MGMWIDEHKKTKGYARMQELRKQLQDRRTAFLERISQKYK